MSGRALLPVMILLAAVFAGCVSDSAVPESGPLTLHEAHRLGQHAVAPHASMTHLVGFVGHEGPAPRYLDGLLAEYVVDVHAADPARWDGRTSAWALLYGTASGELYRVTVRDAPRDIGVEEVADAPRDIVRQLWGMNLDGRLVVDSDQAVARLLEEDETIQAYRDEHPGADLVYASTVAPVEGQGTEDLLYEIYLASPSSQGRHFDLYGQVHHFSGRVVATGDADSIREQRRVTLLEESFTVGPLPLEVWAEERLPRLVEDARMTLTVTGPGLYTLRLIHENTTLLAESDGAALAEPATEEVPLGTLQPGTYTLHIEVRGRVTFDLRIDGTIGI